MATIYFTNDYDSGDGSLRAAIESATAGDTISPDPSATWGDGDITIELSSALSSKSINIVGSPARRIVLDGQGATRFYNVSSSLNISFQYVDFKDGARSDAAPIYISKINSGDAWSFDSCRFYGGSGNYSGGIQLATANAAGSVSFNNCVAFNNASTGSYNSGVPTPVFLYVATASVATVSIANSTLAKGTNRASVGGLGGTVTKTNSLIADDVDFETVGFVDAANGDFRLAPGSAYLTGGASAGVDFLGRSRSGSVGAFDGSYVVVAASGSKTVSDNATCDYLEVGAGATVSFSGTDRILAATKSATLGAATFQATSGSTGYLAVPAGTTTSSATLSGVKIATYGAGASDVAATRTGVSWSATDSTKSVLIEKHVSSAWTTVDASTGTSYSVSLAVGDVVRVFDGAQFLSATVPDSPEPVADLEFHPWATYGATVSVSVFPRWSVVVADSATIIRTLGYILMSDYYNRGETPVLFARIVDSATGDIIDPSDVESISYTCYRKTYSWANEIRTPVEGHSNVSIPVAAILADLVDDDSRWTVDSTGYNFIFEPDSREDPLLPQKGDYEIVVQINLENANPVPLVFNITVS